MRVIFLFFVPFLLSCAVWAGTPSISLEKAPIDRNDKASIERGAKFFASICMSCHTLIYLRYNNLAIKAGITYDKMPINNKWPEGAKPPDLSLEADARGVDWIYTYLHSFYVDPKNTTGFNNLLVTNTKMPDIVAVYQGQQALAKDLRAARNLTHSLQWFDVVALQSQGSMTPAQFDATMADVVNFLAYAAEPFHVKQVKIGKWVILYLLILFFFVYLLKRQYWKDVH